ncbi:MAG: tetratricopeptide repeat protein [Acidimicrobiia bacterium]
MSAPTRDDDALARERAFLLRSLDDLDAEHDAGNVDDGTYDVLRDDYTARAAAVLRAIEGTGSPVPELPPVSARRRVLTGLGILTFAVVAAVALASALGARLPGQTASGNSQQAVSKESAGKALAEAARKHPDDLAAQLTYARYLDQNHQYTKAQRAYEAAVKLGPDNGDALSASAWFLYRVAQSATDDSSRQLLLQTARDRLDRAVRADPSFPDAHVFRGVVLFRGFGDAAGAVPEFQQYLVDQPDGPMSSMVRSVLAEAQRAVDASSTTVPAVPSTTGP